MTISELRSTVQCLYPRSLHRSGVWTNDRPVAPKNISGPGRLLSHQQGLAVGRNPAGHSYLIRAPNLITEAANKPKHVSPVPPRFVPSRETSRHRKIKRNLSLVRLAGGDLNIRSQTARLPQSFPWSNKHRTTARLYPPFVLQVVLSVLVRR